MAAIITPLSGTVTTSARVNVRKGAPSTKAPAVRRLEKDTTFDAIGLTVGENVAGEDNWYAGANEEFVWAGAVRHPPEGLAGGLGHVREDGTLKNLSIAEIRALYGDFTYKEGQGGAIIPDPAWAKANIVDLHIGGIVGGKGATLQVHKRALPYFQKAFGNLAAAGLSSRIVTYNGSYVPRHMGWDPKRALSSHSWGVAVDLNTAWNGYGAEPALLGQVGSLREVVPIFEAVGFAWGGRFKPDSLRDGMHFELALTSPAESGSRKSGNRFSARYPL